MRNLLTKVAPSCIIKVNSSNLFIPPMNATTRHPVTAADEAFLEDRRHRFFIQVANNDEVTSVLNLSCFRIKKGMTVATNHIRQSFPCDLRSFIVKRCPMAPDESNDVAGHGEMDWHHGTRFFRKILFIEWKQRKFGRESASSAVEDSNFEKVIARVSRWNCNVKASWEPCA